MNVSSSIMFKMPKIVWFNSGLRIDLPRLREEKKLGYLVPTFNNIMFVPTSPPYSEQIYHYTCTHIYIARLKKNPKVRYTCIFRCKKWFFNLRNIFSVDEF